MNITSVEINAKHSHLTILCGSLYVIGRCLFVEDFRSIGRFEEYEPDVSLEETGEEEYAEESESSSESSEYPYFSTSCSRRRECFAGDDLFVTFNTGKEAKAAIPRCSIEHAGMLCFQGASRKSSFGGQQAFLKDENKFSTFLL